MDMKTNQPCWTTPLSTTLQANHYEEMLLDFQNISYFPKFMMLFQMVLVFSNVDIGDGQEVEKVQVEQPLQKDN